MADLVIKINGDVKNFQEALDKAKKSTENLSDGLTSIAKISGVAFAALTAEVGLSVAAFSESDQATRKLTAALNAQGLQSDRLVKSYRDQAKAIQELSGMDDDAVISAQALLQTMIGQTEITDELTLAMANLSAAKDMDLKASAELIGKGIEGNITGLKKLGLELDESMTKEQRLAEITAQLNQKFEGQAKVAGEGVAGSMRKLHQAFSDFQENLGAKFAPMIERATNGIAAFFKYASENEALIRLAAAVIAAGVALTGIVTVLATVGVALTSATAIASAFGVTLAVALGPIGLVTAAVVALAAAFGVYATSLKDTRSPVDGLKEDLKKLRSEYEKLDQMDKARLSFDPKSEIKRKKEATALAIQDAEERLRKLESLESESDSKRALNAKTANDKRAAEEARHQRTLAAQREVTLAELNEESQAMIALKKEEAETLAKIEDEKNASIRNSLMAHLAEVRQLKEDQARVDQEKRLELFELELEQEAEFAKLSDEQRRAFAEQNRAQIEAQVMTEEEVRRQMYAQRLQAQVQANNTFLLEQKKFGTAYAVINKAMHSEVYQGTKGAFGEMAQMQTSENARLKQIGRVAAVANIAMKSAESAMNIYAGFSTIPIIGQALGIAGAAAAIMFGAEQARRVYAAADGGLITGGVAGKDSVPAMLMPGELVVPKNNFEEVISAVQSRRQAISDTGTDEAGISTARGGPSEVKIVMELKDGLMDFVETKLVERSNIGISLQRVT